MGSRLVHGVGINDADYPVTKNETVNGKSRQLWRCPFYFKWKALLERCYSPKSLSRFRTYEHTTVCDEWLTFSNFKAWMETQDWEGKYLDKDYLKEGSKVYSPETCVFVTNKINCFINDQNLRRGDGFLTGAYKVYDKYKALCNNPFTNEGEYLGMFNTELDAHLAWKRRKHELACMLVESGETTDERVINILLEKYK